MDVAEGKEGLNPLTKTKINRDGRVRGGRGSML